MKWFYNLKSKWRVFITVAAWVVLFAFCGAIGGSIGANGESMQIWQEIIVIVLLAVSIVFTVFAIKAANKDKKDSTTQTDVQKTIESTPPQKSIQILHLINNLTSQTQKL